MMEQPQNPVFGDTAALSAAWRDSILRKTLVGSFVPPGTLIYLSHRDTVESALNTLNNAQILSAPVINTDTNMCWGSVDLLDLIMYVIWLPPAQMSSFPNVAQMKQRFSHTLSNVMSTLGQHEFFAVLDTVNLAQVIANYLSKRIHRVVVSNSANKIVGILAQWDIIEFMNSRMGTQPEFKMIGDKSLSDLFDLSRFRNVITINENSSLLDAFRAMLSSNVSALAIVDQNNKLIGNLSSSDFKGFDATTLPHTRTIKLSTFMKGGPIFCKADTKFAECIDTIVTNRIHRVYLVDDMQRPAAVISLTDIMNLLTSLLAL